MRKRAVAAVGILAISAIASNASAQATSYSDLGNETVLTGHVGSAFGGELDEESVAFGGTFSWLWRSTVGAEVMAGFAPNFSVAGRGLDDTQINNYMVNAIAAIPLGVDAQWQPFVSGGIGALTLNTGDELESVLGIGDIDETELGGNVGFGLMGFADNWGFRGDVRYFSQMGDPDTETLFLDDLDFWRANVGLGYRW
jgi:hypothetical protein